MNYDEYHAYLRGWIMEEAARRVDEFEERMIELAGRMKVSVPLAELCFLAPTWDSSVIVHAAVTYQSFPDDIDPEKRFTLSQQEHADACACMDCGVHTQRIGEYYCLKNEVWYSQTWTTGGCGMLCLGCFEGRLGRKLDANDFVLSVPINNGTANFKRSERFLDRLSQ